MAHFITTVENQSFLAHLVAPLSHFWVNGYRQKVIMKIPEEIGIPDVGTYTDAERLLLNDYPEGYRISLANDSGDESYECCSAHPSCPELHIDSNTQHFCATSHSVKRATLVADLTCLLAPYTPDPQIKVSACRSRHHCAG